MCRTPEEIEFSLLEVGLYHVEVEVSIAHYLYILKRTFETINPKLGIQVGIGYIVL